VLAQMSLQVAALHAAIRNSSDSVSAAGSTSACSPKRSSRMPCRASITFSRASSRVRPWLRAPGTSGIDATIQPSSSGSNTIVRRNGSLTAQTVPVQAAPAKRAARSAPRRAKGHAGAWSAGGASRRQQAWPEGEQRSVRRLGGTLGTREDHVAQRAAREGRPVGDRRQPPCRRDSAEEAQLDRRTVAKRDR
jgi:hypothetical protein